MAVSKSLSIKPGTLTYRHGFPVAGGRLPLLGHSHRVLYHVVTGSDFSQLLAADEQTYGPGHWIDGPLGPQLQLFGPDILELLRRPELRNPSQVAGDLGPMFFAVDGAQHRRLRGAVQPLFTPRGLGVAGVVATIRRCAERSWPQLIKDKTSAPLAHMRSLGLDIILRLVGIRVADLRPWHRRFAQLGRGFAPSSLPAWLPGSPAWSMARALAYFDRGLSEVVAAERASPSKGTLLSTMVHGVGDGKPSMSELELLRNLTALALAGHETSASGLAWVMFYLGANPEAWLKLQAECAEPLDPDMTPVNLLKARPFAGALFREALRLHPPAYWLSREVTEPLEFRGQMLPAGARLSLNIGRLGRDPNCFVEPNSWRPERWLGDELQSLPSRVVNSQFGGGVHFCLGYHLALTEACVVLDSFARALCQRGLRPELVGSMPACRYFPLVHPDPRARLRFSP